MTRRYRIRLPGAVHELLADEDRAGNLVVGGAGVVGALAFAAAVLAMLWMH
jgi:threonine dehydrogenase-like Zn-dependent dehydrogenase